MANFLKSLFGSKADRDMRQLKPILNKILAEYDTLDRLSDDDLREACQQLKASIAERTAAQEAEAAQIREQLAEVEISVSEKERLATRLDNLVKEIDVELEKALDDALPRAFAIMKSTARRFKENPTIRAKK